MKYIISNNYIIFNNKNKYKYIYRIFLIYRFYANLVKKIL